jgi:hypothetical protein
MKKIFTLLSLMGIITSGFAQFKNGGDRDRGNDGRNGYNEYHRNSALVIKAFTEKRFTVMVDNMQYQLNSDYGRGHDNVIDLGAINAGKHTITIYEARNSFWGKQKQKEVYCATMFLKPGVETSININGYAQVRIAEKQLFNNSYGYGRDDRKDDRRGNDNWDNNRH